MSSRGSHFLMMFSPGSRFWMMSLPGSRFFDDVFSRKPFLDDVFSRKPFFGWCLLQEAVLEKMLFGKSFLWNVWKMLGKIFEQSIQESRPKIRGPNSSWKRLGQKAKPGPSKNRFKFQNNNPKTGRRALARRPVFGRRRLRRRVVVLKFVSIFCRTLLGFLAELFCWLDSLMAYALGLVFPWIFGRWKNFVQKATPNTFFQTAAIQKLTVGQN